MEGKIEWSSTRIDAANYCVMRYYLKYIERTPALRLSSYLKGDLLHRLIQDFWKKLGNHEEVSRKGDKRYSDAQEFAEYAQRMWDHSCIMAENSERPVNWRFKDERWAIRSGLEDICKNLFPILQEEGPPLHSELKFKFYALGKWFMGKIDEIRMKDKRIMVRDYKSGNPFVGEMKLKHDPQLTIYGTALSMLMRDEESVRELGLQKFAENFTGNFNYINPELHEELFMIESPARIEQKKQEGKKTGLVTINPTTRTDNHFLEVVKMIDVVQGRIDTGSIVAERGRKCDFCDMRFACEKKLQEVGQDFMADKKGQFCLEFAIPDFAKKPEEPGKKDPNQGKFNWRLRKAS